MRKEHAMLLSRATVPRLFFLTPSPSLSTLCYCKHKLPIRTMSTAASSTNPRKAPSPQPIRFGPYEVTTQVFLETSHSFALVNLKPLLPGHVLVCPHRPHKRLTDMSMAEVTDLFATVRRVQHMLARHYFGLSGSRPASVPSPSSSLAAAAATVSLHPGRESEGEARGKEGESRSRSRSGGTGGEETSPDDGSFNIAIQDGADAGQTVPHVHVHVIPRIPGHTAKDGNTLGDAIYEDMAGEKGNVGGALWDRGRGGGRGGGRTDNGDGNNGRPVPGGSFDRIEDADRMARSMEEMEREADVFRRVLARMEAEEDS